MTLNPGFVDHFAPLAADYAEFRPRYPEALFNWLASLTPGRTLAWDCATGNGQAAVGLAALFERVIATDASAAQIAQATPHPRIEYRVAHAESSGLREQSADIVTVAQALHWFDRSRFFAEVRRALKPGGLLAVWTYGAMCSDDPAIDALLRRFQTEIVGPCWPPERALVDSGYRSIEFPFPTLTDSPSFAMSAVWTLPELFGYLGTWTATRTYRMRFGHDPRERIRDALLAAWGSPEAKRPIAWPLTVHVARKPPWSSWRWVQWMGGHKPSQDWNGQALGSVARAASGFRWRSGVEAQGTPVAGPFASTPLSERLIGSQ